jgi:hypothetical protein
MLNTTQNVSVLNLLAHTALKLQAAVLFVRARFDACSRGARERWLLCIVAAAALLASRAQAASVNATCGMSPQQAPGSIFRGSVSVPCRVDEKQLLACIASLRARLVCHCIAAHVLFESRLLRTISEESGRWKTSRCQPLLGGTLRTKTSPVSARLACAQTRPPTDAPPADSPTHRPPARTRTHADRSVALGATHPHAPAHSLQHSSCRNALASGCLTATRVHRLSDCKLEPEPLFTVRQ